MFWCARSGFVAAPAIKRCRIPTITTLQTANATHTMMSEIQSRTRQIGPDGMRKPDQTPAAENNQNAPGKQRRAKQDVRHSRQAHDPKNRI